MAILLAVPLVLSACHFSRVRVNVENFHDKAAGVEAGSTTSDQLVDMLGTQPNKIIDLEGDKQAYVYIFGDSKTKGLTLIIINILKTNTGIDTAVFVLDSNDVVEEVHISSNSEDLPWEWWAWGD
jgi:hypothetical protein